MLLKAAAGAIGASVAALTFSGIFTTSSASSPVTSATRTITGTGTLLFNNLGGVTLSVEYNKNASGWNTITDGLTLSMNTTDTLAVRSSLAIPSNTTTFDIRNNGNGALIESVTLTRT
jgi:hypothetical protein